MGRTWYENSGWMVDALISRDFLSRYMFLQKVGLRCGGCNPLIHIHWIPRPDTTTEKLWNMALQSRCGVLNPWTSSKIICLMWNPWGDDRNLIVNSSLDPEPHIPYNNKLTCWNPLKNSILLFQLYVLGSYKFDCVPLNSMSKSTPPSIADMP